MCLVISRYITRTIDLRARALHYQRNNTKNFQDELQGKYLVNRSVTLRSKCYSLEFIPSPEYIKLLKRCNQLEAISNYWEEFKNGDHVCYNRCKGTNRRVVNETRTDDFCLIIGTRTPKYVHQTVIRNKNHTLATVTERRQMLSPMVDKRHLYPCMIHTDPLGSQIIDDWNNNNNISKLCPYQCT